MFRIGFSYYIFSRYNNNFQSLIRFGFFTINISLFQQVFLIFRADRKGRIRIFFFTEVYYPAFFPAKPVGCYGDGGAVFTNNDEWAALIESYRVHGKGTFKYDNVRIGMNSRLDTVQAAVLQVKLKAFAKYELDAVNEAAARYTDLLKGFATPVIPDGFRSSWAQYTLRLRDKEQRDTLQATLKEQGIPSMVYYPKPMHLQTAFSSNVMPDVLGHPCPVATSLCDRVLSLPMHPYLTEEEIQTVSTAVLNALR